jgi:hypothetical protein
LGGNFSPLRGCVAFAVVYQDSHGLVVKLSRGQAARGLLRYTPALGKVQDGIGGTRTPAAMSP